MAHKLGKRRRNTIDIGAAVFVHGFDIPCDDPAFAAAFQRAKRITDQFDTELIQVRSNLKQLLPLWTTTFSAAVSAVLSLLEWRFSAGLIAASIAYENMHWVASHDGSTPLTDGLLSSTRFLVVPDLARTRVEKTSTLADCGIWPHLRVCWQGDEASTNCGTCEKCVRQMLCMMASGLHDFSAFETPLTPESVLATELPMEVVTEEWNACYDYAYTRGLTDQPTFVAMKEVLDRTAFGAEAGPVRDAKGRGNLLFHPWQLVRHLLGS